MYVVIQKILNFKILKCRFLFLNKKIERKVFRQRPQLVGIFGGVLRLTFYSEKCIKIEKRISKQSEILYCFVLGVLDIQCILVKPIKWNFPALLVQVHAALFPNIRLLAVSEQSIRSATLTVAVTHPGTNPHNCCLTSDSDHTAI